MSNAQIPQKAFILAAGLGTRMRPLTDTLPKPMVEVLGKPMIGHALAALEAAGVRECVVNTHYKAEILQDYLKTLETSNIKVSHEETLLDTGGGIAAMKACFPDPFFVLSGDSVWDPLASPKPLIELAQAWNSERMDILMLLQPVETMRLTRAAGDYDILPNGQAIRRLDKSGAHMFTSIRINAPHIFAEYSAEPFSYLKLLDRAQSQGRLYGLVHTGLWHHISTPEDLKRVNSSYA